MIKLGLRINKSADRAFNSRKAMIIFVLISIALSAFISYSFRGPYLNASAGAHLLLFIIPMALLASLSRVILNVICAIVRAITLPAFLIQRRRDKKLGYETQSGGFERFEEADVGLRYFIENEKMDFYNIKFLN